MTVELDRKDIESLVRGTSPYYSLFEDPIIKSMGYFTGGFVERWTWNNSFPNITDEQLFIVYQKCRDSWT